jgi:hypothetical protein
MALERARISQLLREYDERSAKLEQELSETVELQSTANNTPRVTTLSNKHSAVEQPRLQAKLAEAKMNLKTHARK